MKHKLNTKSQAEATDDSSADTTMSSQPIANITVVRSQSRVGTLSDNYINFCVFSLMALINVIITFSFIKA